MCAVELTLLVWYFYLKAGYMLDINSSQCFDCIGTHVSVQDYIRVEHANTICDKNPALKAMVYRRDTNESVCRPQQIESLVLSRTLPCG